MPEGPEIRLAADRVERVLRNQVLDAVIFGVPSLRRFQKRLTGRVVTRIDTRGKAMLTRFDNDLTLYSHNQLYGRWFTTRRPEMPDTRRQLRVALHTSSHSALLYSASDVAVLTAAQLKKHPFLARLGPDVLDPALTEALIMKRLRRPEFKNRALGGLYLDQGFLAGNGNYLRSEILWVARAHPSRKPVDLAPQELRRLARETLRVARRSYRTRGVTVPDRLARELRAGGAGYESYRFYTYGREGLPCRQCAAPIARGKMGSRAVFFCPVCQPS